MPNVAIKVSVVMPAFNEAPFLMRTALETAAVLERAYGSAYELILVDDGSTDDTLAVARDASRLLPRCTVVSYLQNAGKGHAMRRGFERARGDVVAFLDSDGEIEPQALLALIGLLDGNEADIVVGRKVMVGRRPWHRQVMRWGVRWIGHMAFGLPVTDPQTGVKAISRHKAGPYLAACLERGYLFDLEFLALAQRAGARLRQVDVEVRQLRPNRIPSSVGLRHLVAAGDLWLRFRRTAPVAYDVPAGPKRIVAPTWETEAAARPSKPYRAAHPPHGFALAASREEPTP